MLKFLNQPAAGGLAGIVTAGCAGFILVLVFTLIFGRVYCSTICPLGTFQDLIFRLGPGNNLLRGKKTKRYQYEFSKPHNRIRYTIFFVTTLLFLAGSGILLNLLDPFSSFGRIFSNLFRPLVLALNNLGVPLAEGLGSHILYRMPWPMIAPVSLGVSLAVLVLVVWLSARHGRLYCNTICPVGALLGLVSKVSLFRIGIDKNACKGCKRCRNVCKAGCIDLKNNIVDFSRCVACCNCLSVCPDQAVKIIRGGLWQTRQVEPEPGRRGFILGLAAGGLGLVTRKAVAEPISQPVQSRPTTIPEKKTCPISPPGSIGIAQFTAACTACHLCVTTCPSRVLVPSFLSYGFAGMMQPQMNFQVGHCNYDCTACTQVCPSGAILPLSKEDKRLTQVGTAKFIRENCVVYTDNTNCGACSEHCPTKAVHMVPYLNAPGRKLVIPEVNETICVGCGGCEHACPTRPYKAIYVDGNPKHLLAEKPVEKKVDQTTDTGEAFPF
jgi:ferredoxin